MYWHATRRIDNYTAALEPLGIEIGDWVAIGALIFSTLTFWFGYVRTKKSEQIKAAKEIMDDLDKSTQRVNESPSFPINGDANDEFKYYGSRYAEYSHTTRIIRTATYFVNSKIISKKNFRLYVNGVIVVLNQIDTFYDDLKKSKCINKPDFENIDQFRKRTRKLKETWEGWMKEHWYSSSEIAVTDE